MKHFDLGQWANFVRAAGNGSARAAMQVHLDSGCRRCETLVGQLRRVAALPAADALQAPPDYAVRSIKAYFGLNRPEIRPQARGPPHRSQ